jgi:putative flippase GtrA
VTHDPAPAVRGHGALAHPSLRRLLSTLLQREPVRYLLVAGTVSVLYLGLLAAVLATGIHYMLAVLVAQVVTIGVAFPSYRRLIFRSSGPWRHDLPRFVGVWGGGFVAGFVATPLLVELTGMHPFVAQLVAVVAVAVLSYLGHKFWSFRGAR